MNNEAKSIDYTSPIDEDFQDPNWDSEESVRKTVSPSFIHIEGNEKIPPFYLSNIVVTQKLYEKVMGENPSSVVQDDLPVDNVSWLEAVLFCNKLSSLRNLDCYYSIEKNSVSFNSTSNGYRLPSRKEWIFASVGGNQRNDYIFSGSNSLSDVGWYNANSSCKLQIPGQKTMNTIGLYDMSGNIWELTNDEINGEKIVCGGCCSSNLGDCEILKQGNKTFPANEKHDFIGFRLAKNG